MKFFLEKVHSKTWFWFLLKTIFFYLVIKYFFLAYAGLTIEGGGLYSPFLAEHFDFISMFRRFLLWGGVQFASLIGYPSFHTDYFLLVRGGAGVQLVYSCLGLDLISAYVALVLAWPSKWIYKVVSSLLATATIILLNMVRLGGLAVLYTTGNYGFFEYINHHDLFNIIVLIVVFVMFVVHLKYTEGKNTKLTE